MLTGQHAESVADGEREYNF